MKKKRLEPLKQKPLTIPEVKQCFRDGNSLLVDHIRDPYPERTYIYRLHKRGFLWLFMDDPENFYSIYSVVKS